VINRPHDLNIIQLNGVDKEDVCLITIKFIFKEGEKMNSNKKTAKMNEVNNNFWRLVNVDHYISKLS